MGGTEQIGDHRMGRGHASTPVWILGLIGGSAATLANVGIYLVSWSSHAVSFRIRGQADVFETGQALTTGFRRVELYNVVIDTIVPFALGMLLFGVAVRRSRAAAMGVLIAAAASCGLVVFTIPRAVRIEPEVGAILSAMAIAGTAIFVAVLGPILSAPRG